MHYAQHKTHTKIMLRNLELGFEDPTKMSSRSRSTFLGDIAGDPTAQDADAGAGLLVLVLVLALWPWP